MIKQLKCVRTTASSFNPFLLWISMKENVHSTWQTKPAPFHPNVNLNHDRITFLSCMYLWNLA